MSSDTWSLIQITSLAAIAPTFIILMISTRLNDLRERRESMQNLASELGFTYRFKDPAFWNAGFRRIPFLSGWRINKEIGGVMHGSIVGTESWLFDYRCFGLSSPGKDTIGDINKYTVAVFRFGAGQVPPFVMDSIINPYPVSQKIFHHPLISRLRGTWTLQCDGEWLSLTRYNGYRSYTDSDIESYRTFFAEATEIAKQMPGVFSA